MVERFQQSIWSSESTKVKTSLQQTDTPIIKQQLEAEYIQFNLDNRSEKTDVEDELKTVIAGKNLTESRTIFEAIVDFINTIPELMDRRFFNGNCFRGMVSKVFGCKNWWCL